MTSEFGLPHARERALANLAHQLRTPLAVIVGYAELLGAREGDALRHEASLHIRSAADVLAGIVDDLLVVLALDADKVLVDAVPLDLHESLRTALAAARVEDERAPIVADPLPSVSADPEHLQRILRSVLSYSLQRSQPGGVSVSADQNNGVVVTRVRDNGPPLDENVLRVPLDRFAAIELSELPGFRSNGLELYKARRLVELHGGTMWAEDEGRVLAFALPAGAS